MRRRPALSGYASGRQIVSRSRINCLPNYRRTGRSRTPLRNGSSALLAFRYCDARRQHRRSLRVLWFRLAARWSEPFWLLGIAPAASASWDAPPVWLSVGRCAPILLQNHNVANVAGRRVGAVALARKIRSPQSAFRFFGSAPQTPELIARNVFDPDSWRGPPFARQSRLLRLGLREGAGMERELPTRSTPIRNRSIFFGDWGQRDRGELPYRRGARGFRMGW